jgi:hypothetical protein
MEHPGRRAVRAVARVVLPEEEGPLRARIMGWGGRGDRWVEGAGKEVGEGGIVLLEDFVWGGCKGTREGCAGNFIYFEFTGSTNASVCHTISVTE